MAKQSFAGAFNGLFSEVRVQLAPLPELEAFYGSPTPSRWRLLRCKQYSSLANKNRIAAKPRSHMWSTFRKENHQKLTFGEGVQPWDLARCPGRIESYRFIMESSKSKPYSASLIFMHAGKLAVPLSTSGHSGSGFQHPWGVPSPMRGQWRVDLLILGG